MSGQPEPIWLSERVVLAVHDEQIKAHGGAPGLRDAGVLARPMNLAAYQGADLPALAATYAIAITRNHPFVEGNKRTAYVCLELFLALNRWMFPAPNEEAVINMLELAGGAATDEAFAAWVTRHAVPN